MDMFGLSRIFLFHFLFWVLYLGTPLSTSSSKCVPRLAKAPADVVVRETEETPTAYNIYKKFGVGDKNTIICGSADKKTRFIYGYSLCKKAAKGNKAMQEEDSEIIDAKCSWVELSKSKHIHAVKKTGNGNSVGCFPKKTNITYGHVMVECFAAIPTDSYSRKIAYRLLHCRDDTYYIFNNGVFRSHSDAEIVKTKTLKFDANDYPTINVETTDDCLKTDDIFGHYGVMDPKDQKHVCHEDKNTKLLVGELLCTPALEKFRGGLFRNNKLNDMDSKCDTVNLDRMKPITHNFSGYKLQTKVTGIKCWYSTSPTSTESYHILIANVQPKNESQKDYYYILSPRNDQVNNKKIYKLSSVEKLEISDNGNQSGKGNQSRHGRGGWMRVTPPNVSKALQSRSNV